MRSLTPVRPAGTRVSSGYSRLPNTAFRTREAQKLRTVRRKLNNHARKVALAHDSTPRLIRTHVEPLRSIPLAEFLQVVPVVEPVSVERI